MMTVTAMIKQAVQFDDTEQFVNTVQFDFKSGERNE